MQQSLEQNNVLTPYKEPVGIFLGQFIDQPKIN